MPSLARSKGSAWVMFPPLNQMRPEFALMRPIRSWKNVLLPAPLGPMMQRIWPVSIDHETSSTARTPPKALLRFLDHQKHRPN